MKSTITVIFAFLLSSYAVAAPLSGQGALVPVQEKSAATGKASAQVAVSDDDESDTDEDDKSDRSHVVL